MAGGHDNKGDGKLGFSTILLGIGVLLVLFGLWRLAEQFFGVWFADIWHIINATINVLWPALIIFLGIALMYMARKGKLSFPANKKLFRSARNKKLGGVCGGISEYLSVDAAIVRVITIVLVLLCWYIILPLYILFWIIIPLDTKNYNTWV